MISPYLGKRNLSQPLRYEGTTVAELLDKDEDWMLAQDIYREQRSRPLELHAGAEELRGMVWHGS